MMGSGFMHRRLRTVLSFFSIVFVFFLAGCGFVNVANLTPTVKKTYVLLVGADKWLKNVQVENQMADSPQGMSVIPLATDGLATTALLKQINHSTANVVILVQPSTALMQLPASHPNIHFYLIGNSLKITGKNVTVLTENDQQLASIAGYIGGGSVTQGQTISILSGPSVPPAAMTSVVDAVYSGSHAAFSANPVQWVSQPGNTTLAQGVWVLWGTVPANDIVTLAAAKQKVIAVNSSNNLTGMSVVASYSPTSSISGGIQTALNAIYHQLALPKVWNVPAHYQLNTVSSWQQPSGVTNYEQMMTAGTLSPTGFLQNVPSVKTAQSLHLPVPPTLNIAKG